MNHALAADNSEIDMTCDSEKLTLDAERMRDYAIALGSSDLGWRWQTGRATCCITAAA